MSSISALTSGSIQYAGFTEQENGSLFFRPGQIFSVIIGSFANFLKERKFQDIDLGNLPLEPISTFKATADKERDKDRETRLAEIQALSLSTMTIFYEDISTDIHQM
jgi:hypothetical protein